MAYITPTYYGPFDNLGDDRIYDADDFTQMLYCYAGAGYGVTNFSYSISGLNLTINSADIIISGRFCTIRNQTVTMPASATTYISVSVDSTNRAVLCETKSGTESGWTNIIDVTTSASAITNVVVSRTLQQGYNLTTGNYSASSSQPTIYYTGYLWIPADTRS